MFFDRHGQPLGGRGGFDAVIGSPPYVRQEQLTPLKPYLQAAYPETYHGMADLYVYFYQQGLRLLRMGGRMSYIVTNKWLRAGYGEPLRAFFAKESAIEQIIDFGHAPIFADADVFPCIIVLEKRATNGSRQQDDHQVQVTAFPREALKLVQLDGYVRKYSHSVPQSRFPITIAGFRHFSMGITFSLFRCSPWRSTDWCMAVGQYSCYHAWRQRIEQDLLQLPRLAADRRFLACQAQVEHNILE